jgi:hypothetical protein
VKEKLLFLKYPQVNCVMTCQQAVHVRQHYSGQPYFGCVIAHDMFVEPVSAVKGGEPEPVMIIDERHYACNLFPSC